ncbi:MULTISPECIES: efflux RND transporter periplasmic adaptor subunit [unclassified Sphingomonas]|uniref:efflux RND transporter periplasmic adaptor subunit n=1 Tax=unclassified Sphingomonas TaxID=196159 RepID=UPI001F191689|nr:MULTISPECIES: efflux RND transporter periplasmic adaptor subunit [unclassified Sphingomonas]
MSDAMKNSHRPTTACIGSLMAIMLAVMLGGCSAQAPAETTSEIEVLTIRMAPRAVTAVDELPGRVVAFRTAEIRPQVGGIVQRRLFEQGATVHAGQVLFQISPAPFRADADTARATVARAAAAYARTRTQADRLKPLVQADAISRQTYDDAVAAREQASAELAEARATLRRRQIDVGFSRITAPITGRIGATNVTEGALVAAADTNPLATIHQIDRVYVDVRQPAGRYAELREQGAGASTAEIVAAAGQPPLRGRILFSGIAVDPNTGDALVRVEVPNPGERLLPGMFVRARLPRAALPAALLVPQQAVTRAGNGQAQVSVVDGQDRVHVRPVTLGALTDGRYVVSTGLKAGDVVIVEGQDRIRPDTPVRQRPWRDRTGG